MGRRRGCRWPGGDEGAEALDTCAGIRAARHGVPTDVPSDSREQEPAVPPAPAGMVWIPGGEFSMGAQDPPDMNDAVGMKATTDSRPIHRVYVDGFWMDQTEVTNAQFAEFVKATGYVTLAERTPRAEEFPGVPPEKLVAGSVVFSPPSHAVPLDNHFRGGPTSRVRTGAIRSGPELDRGERETSCRARRVRRCRCLREMGRQAASH